MRKYCFGFVLLCVCSTPTFAKKILSLALTNNTSQTLLVIKDNGWSITVPAHTTYQEVLFKNHSLTDAYLGTTFICRWDMNSHPQKQHKLIGIRFDQENETGGCHYELMPSDKV